MNTINIEKIQNQILELLPSDERQQKALLLADSCSELSRLVASWLSEIDDSTSQIILQGDNVCNTNKSHDILASINNGLVFLIDPTVWQFFPDANSILIGEYPSLAEAMAAAAKKYGGKWHQSEELKNISSEDKDLWLQIIKANIKEAVQPKSPNHERSERKGSDKHQLVRFL